jgi:hypothetical protein
MVVGVGWLNPAEVMRDPVTTIASSGWSVEFPWASGGGKSAAPALIGTADRANTDA